MYRFTGVVDITGKSKQTYAFVFTFCACYPAIPSSISSPAPGRKPRHKLVCMSECTLGSMTILLHVLLSDFKVVHVQFVCGFLLNRGLNVTCREVGR
jgi:hypothetical protein